MNEFLRRLAVVLPALAAAVFSSAGLRADDDRLWKALDLSPGMVVADVGAGEGRYSAQIARRVGPGGHVFSTEVDRGKLSEIYEQLEAGETPFTVVLGGVRDAGLPRDCCDRILLRLVYHHFSDPTDMVASLRRALKPGGRLVVVEFEPGRLREVRGVPESRGGHGIAAELATRELGEAGFELIDHLRDWEGRSDRYCLVLTAPQ